MAKQQEHETVGWRFRAGGAIYRCTRYTPSGFDMLLIEGQDVWFDPPRQPGYTTNVSERAIGRTYHIIDNDPHERPSAHIKPCICYVCKLKGR